MWTRTFQEQRCLFCACQISSKCATDVSCRGFTASPPTKRLSISLSGLTSPREAACLTLNPLKIVCRHWHLMSVTWRSTLLLLYRSLDPVKAAFWRWLCFPCLQPAQHLLSWPGTLVLWERDGGEQSIQLHLWIHTDSSVSPTTKNNARSMN